MLQGDLEALKESRKDLTPQIERAERQVRDAEIFLDLLNHQGMRDLINDLEEMVQGINTQLLHPGPNDMMREGLFADRKRCQWFLDKFTIARNNIKSAEKLMQKYE